MGSEIRNQHQDETRRELARLEPYLELFPQLWPELKRDRAIRQAQSWVSSNLYSAKELVAFARDTIQTRQLAQNKELVQALKEGLRALQGE